MSASKYSKCSYLKRDGTICGKGCIGTLCSVHSRCNWQRPCRLCGKGTQSATGICYAPGECRLAQHAAALRIWRASKNEQPITENDLDSLVDELLE